MKFIAPRLQTPASSERGSRRTTILPDELVLEQVERIALLAAVAGGLWGMGLFMDVILTPLAWSTPISFRSVFIEVAGIAAAAWMYWYARHCTCPGQRKTDASLGFFLFNGIGIAVINTWITPPTTSPAIDLSWMAIAILIFAMIAPVSPRKILITSLVAASLDPLALLVAFWLGNPVTSVPHASILVLPNYACAVVAMLPSQVLYRLGRRLREAQELGSYQLVDLLGQGGMGEVWSARHRLLARDAAIKLVRPELLGVRSEAEARVLLRRFEREAQATATLSSPHTIRLFDFGMTSERTFYYVMELLAGRDLETLVREFGPLPADRAVFLLRQACHSLAEAHARGMVHRDVKPANIYACRMGLDYDFVKVLDFGLVKVRDRSAGNETILTADHTTTGTPAYMAPEIILGEVEVDRRADVYALGCVAYYLLTGCLVFEAETPMKMLLRHAHEKPLPPSQRTELSIPRELDDLVLACLEKNPNDRPQSAEAMFSMVVGCKAGESWNQQSARAWWRMHLPDLTGPLTQPEKDTAAGTRRVVAV